MTFSFNPQSEIPNPQLFRLFVYGTLKRGFRNHDRFCRGVLDIREAVVRGRLYEMHSGIPVLQVPDEDILAHGASDALADVGHTGAPFRTVGLILRTGPAKRHSGRLGPRVRGASHLQRSRVPPARHRPPGGVPPG
ncbi:gamma-glutamylcyclotransferase [Desulfobulbus rhabdoformis]|uniref:gamma-glutamylcyclotransferase n=1 Tax=Desulfobulbus rhabdoformis TaxID=34032 RepID=UPI001964E529|nr:gamma-glutamylcyclotransferase [Desulfobulbus rhabdoformis]